jgi:hypothetical protein
METSVPWGKLTGSLTGQAETPCVCPFMGQSGSLILQPRMVTDKHGLFCGDNFDFNSCALVFIRG